MIDSRRKPRAALNEPAGETYAPSSSGPRCLNESRMRTSACSSTGSRPTIPQIPHIAQPQLRERRGLLEVPALAHGVRRLRLRLVIRPYDQLCEEAHQQQVEADREEEDR